MKTTARITLVTTLIAATSAFSGTINPTASKLVDQFRIQNSEASYGASVAAQYSKLADQIRISQPPEVGRAAGPKTANPCGHSKLMDHIIMLAKQ